MRGEKSNYERVLAGYKPLVTAFPGQPQEAARNPRTRGTDRAFSQGFHHSTVSLNSEIPAKPFHPFHFPVSRSNGKSLVLIP